MLAGAAVQDTPEAVKRFELIKHNFTGPDIRKVGWVRGGPVYLNRYFLDADLRIVVGSVIPHSETGFGGGAKMVVPGVSGRLTIAHFHGALPPRPAGKLESTGDGLDRRDWAEAVANHVGVHAAVCAVINSRRELAGLYVGDVVQAYLAAARRARKICQTVILKSLAAGADIVAVSTYPLDTDPIQMSKSIDIGRKLSAPLTVVLNSASDGIFYHGMGMGCGIDFGRLLRNVPGWLADTENIGAWLLGMLVAIRRPMLTARFCYFSLNHLSYDSFQKRLAQQNNSATTHADSHRLADPLVVSGNMPAWGFRRKYPRGQLYRDWNGLLEAVRGRFARPRVLVFPCGPMQLVEIV